MTTQALRRNVNFRRLMRSRPYLLLAIVIVLWGVNYIVARILSGLDPVRVSGILYGFFRYFLGALTMVVILISQRRSIEELMTVTKSYKLPLMMSAVFSAIFVISTHMSAEYVSSGTTSIIVNLCPIVVLLYGVAFFGESISFTKSFGFLIGLLSGAWFLLSVLTTSPSSIEGLVLAMIGMFSWAAYTITLHYLEGADCFVVMTVKHGISSAMVIPFIALYLSDGGTLVLTIDPLSVLGLLFAGIMASGVAYVLYFSAIEDIGAPKASSFLFLVPFVSLTGDFVLGEPLSPLSLLAGTLAVIGVALVKLSKS